MGAVPVPEGADLGLSGPGKPGRLRAVAHAIAGRVVGARLITIYVMGRKSGRHYAVPVAHTRHDGALLVGTPFGWGRHTTCAPARRWTCARRTSGDGPTFAVVTDEDGVVENYAVTACDNPVRDVEQDQFGAGRRAERS